MSPPRKQSRTVFLLRRADQLALGLLALAGFVALGAYWFINGGHRGQLIDIDRAQPRHFQYQVDLNSADWSDETSPEVWNCTIPRLNTQRVIFA